MIATAKLKGFLSAGDNFTPRGVSQQGLTLEVDGAWPNLPPGPGGLGNYSPSWSLTAVPGTPVLQPDGSYRVPARFKIDETGFFDDENAAVEYWLDRVVDLEIEGLGADVDPSTLILSYLEINGVESGEPYAVVFDVEYRVEGPGPLGVRAVFEGIIARSSLKGGKGRAEVKAALAKLSKAA